MVCCLIIRLLVTRCYFGEEFGVFFAVILCFPRYVTYFIYTPFPIVPLCRDNKYFYLPWGCGIFSVGQR